MPEALDGRNERMIREQIASRKIEDPRIHEAFRRTPRRLFVPAEFQAHAYEDRPLPIGHGQTISQPYIVGFMTETLAVEPQHKVLEIGTGSGYQTAILSRLAAEVYTVEVVEGLAKTAA